MSPLAPEKGSKNAIRIGRFLRMRGRDDDPGVWSGQSAWSKLGHSPAY
jgi:hypothetical protein